MKASKASKNTKRNSDDDNKDHKEKKPKKMAINIQRRRPTYDTPRSVILLTQRHGSENILECIHNILQSGYPSLDMVWKIADEIDGPIGQHGNIISRYEITPEKWRNNEGEMDFVLVELIVKHRLNILPHYALNGSWGRQLETFPEQQPQTFYICGIDIVPHGWTGDYCTTHYFVIRSFMTGTNMTGGNERKWVVLDSIPPYGECFFIPFVLDNIADYLFGSAYINDYQIRHAGRHLEQLVNEYNDETVTVYGFQGDPSRLEHFSMLPNELDFLQIRANQAPTWTGDAGAKMMYDLKSLKSYPSEFP
jgi:hypothetical protein